MSEFIIVFREVLEASLVVGIIYLILEKSNQLSHLYKLWLGAFSSNCCKHFSWFFCSRS
jgi:high-affinity Fe2+/Pb2+ permease